MDVAQPALAALGQHRCLVVGGQVRQNVAGLDVGHHGADGKAQDDVFRRRAIAVRSATLFAVARAMDAGIAIFDQRIDVAIGYGKDAAAAAAVAAVRSAARDELLAPEARAAVPAFSGMDFDVRFVDEFHNLVGPIGRQDAKKECGNKKALPDR